MNLKHTTMKKMKMHLHTKATDDSKLYLTIDSLVDTLRQKNYSDNNIKKVLSKVG